MIKNSRHLYPGAQNLHIHKSNLLLLLLLLLSSSPLDGRIILRGIFRKWERVVGTGWSGLRIGTGGGHL
jgi:hypothetical protein